MSNAETPPKVQTLTDLIRDSLSGSDEAATAYLRQNWLDAAMYTLWKARRAAGLTQAEVAARMGTTQSSIARLERDGGGGISLRRFIDYALACGMSPLDLELITTSSLRRYALADPDAPRTHSAVTDWLEANPTPHARSGPNREGKESHDGTPEPTESPVGQSTVPLSTLHQ
jgi:transcriptional regulator with XRE-family HTH domain